jgi:hypothetical protein
MENNDHHMLGDSSEDHHNLGDSIIDMYGDGISRRAYDLAEQHPYLVGGALGTAGLVGAAALAPELTVAGLGAGAGELASLAGYGDAVMDATNALRLGQSAAALMGIV